MMKVSAIIITHNRKSLLQAAIESVKKQTYENIEIIVVDDASNDGTDFMCKKILGIHYIRITEKNSKGGNYARNLGVRSANGELIAFLDDDDTWFPEKTKIMVEEFVKHPNYGMVYCGRIMACGKRLFDYPLVINCARCGNLSDDFKIDDVLATSSAIMIRREVYEKIGGFDENLKCWQDYEFIFRIKKNCEIGVVPAALVRYRRELGDRNRLTNQYDKWREAVEYIEKKHREIFKSLDKMERKKWTIMCLNEAAYRVAYTQQKNKMRKYYHKLFLLTGRLDYLIREVLNISRQDTFYVECLMNKIKYLCSRGVYLGNK